jgi:hypothetical protein
MSAVWEPWHPVIGQRVRVLARPECFYCREDHDAETGETGVIFDLWAPVGEPMEPGQAAHRVWVRFDDPTIRQRTVHGCLFSHFAVIELEPVNEEVAP